MKMSKIFFQDRKKFVADCRLPVFPLKYEKIINDIYAYVIDGNGIIWTRESHEEYQGAYTSHCLGVCLVYITSVDGFYAYLSIKKYIRKHLTIEAEKRYNNMLGKYDGEWIEKYG